MNEDKVFKILIFTILTIVTIVAVFIGGIIINKGDKYATFENIISNNDTYKFNSINQYKNDLESIQTEQNENDEIDILENKNLIKETYSKIVTATKYEEDGITKYQSSIINNGTQAEYAKLVYDYNFNNYGVEFKYPTEWINGMHNTSQNYGIAFCEENDYNSEAMKIFVSEINISNYTNLTNEQYIEMLKNNIEDYIQNGSEIYSINNMKVEDLNLDGEIYKILSYKYNEGRYNSKYVYSIVEIGQPYMYILSAVIPEEKLNEKYLEIRNEVIKSYKIFDASEKIY